MRMFIAFALAVAFCSIGPARSEVLKSCDITPESRERDLSGPFYLGPADSAACSFVEADSSVLRVVMVNPFGNFFALRFETAGNNFPLEIRLNGELVGSTGVGGVCDSGDYVETRIQIYSGDFHHPFAYFFEIGLSETSPAEEFAYVRNLSIFGEWVTPTEQRTWGSVKARF